jgi:Site-specific recombinase XerD
MTTKTSYVTRRSGIFYVQFWHNQQLIRVSLGTDSPRLADQYMVFVRPAIHALRTNRTDKEEFLASVKAFLTTNETVNLTKYGFSFRDQKTMTEQSKQLIKKANISFGQTSANILSARFGLHITTFQPESVILSFNNSSLEIAYSDSRFCSKFNAFAINALTLYVLTKSKNEIDLEILNAVDDMLPIAVDYAESLSPNEIQEKTQELRAVSKGLRHSALLNQKTYRSELMDIFHGITNVKDEYVSNLSKLFFYAESMTSQPLDALAALLEDDHDKYFDIQNKFTTTEPVPVVHVIQPPTSVIEQTPLKISEVFEKFFIKKTTRYVNKGKQIDGNRMLRRQKQFAMKVVAISNDYDVRSTSKNEVIDFLWELFHWPDENVKGSIFNSKKQKSLDWYTNIAKQIPELKKDLSVKKAAAQVFEIVGFLQEVYKWLESSEFNTVRAPIPRSPVKDLPSDFEEHMESTHGKRGSYSPAEMQSIIELFTKSSDPLRWPIFLQTYTGMRPSELYLLKPENFNFEFNYIYCPGTKTDNATRYIPLAQKLIDLGIKDLVSQFQNDQPFMQNVYPEANMNAKFIQFIKPLNIKKNDDKTLSKQVYFRSMYSIRKSFSTHNKSKDAEAIELCLGHAISDDLISPERKVYKIKDQQFSDELLSIMMEDLRPVVETLPY